MQSLGFEAEKKQYVLRKNGVIVYTGTCENYRAKGRAIQVIALSNMRQGANIDKIAISKQVSWRRFVRAWRREWRRVNRELNSSYLELSVYDHVVTCRLVHDNIRSILSDLVV